MFICKSGCRKLIILLIYKAENEGVVVAMVTYTNKIDDKQIIFFIMINNLKLPKIITNQYLQEFEYPSRYKIITMYFFTPVFEEFKALVIIYCGN